MNNTHTIFVTSLFAMPHHVRQLRPARLVSIIQPEFQPPRPGELTQRAHLRIEVHDIAEPQFDQVLAEREDIERLVEFIDDWQPDEGALLTHCYAGVSRSTATALIACYMKTGDAVLSARSLRTASPHAEPNRHIIALADEVLNCDGELIEAREAMGARSVMIDYDAPLTTLRMPPAH